MCASRKISPSRKTADFKFELVSGKFFFQHLRHLSSAPFACLPLTESSLQNFAFFVKVHVVRTEGLRADACAELYRAADCMMIKCACSVPCAVMRLWLLCLPWLPSTGMHPAPLSATERAVCLQLQRRLDRWSNEIGEPDGCIIKLRDACASTRSAKTAARQRRVLHDCYLRETDESTLSFSVSGSQRSLRVTMHLLADLSEFELHLSRGGFPSSGHRSLSAAILVLRELEPKQAFAAVGASQPVRQLLLTDVKDLPSNASCPDTRGIIWTVETWYFQQGWILLTTASLGWTYVSSLRTLWQPPFSRSARLARCEPSLFYHSLRTEDSEWNVFSVRESQQVICKCIARHKNSTLLPWDLGMTDADVELFLQLKRVVLSVPAVRVFIIGNSFGFSTSVLGYLFAEKGAGGSVDAIDAEQNACGHAGSWLTRRVAAAEGLDVQITKGISPEDVPAAMRSEQYDLAFVDGLHETEQQETLLAHFQPRATTDWSLHMVRGCERERDHADSDKLVVDSCGGVSVLGIQESGGNHGATSWLSSGCSRELVRAECHGIRENQAPGGTLPRDGSAFCPGACFWCLRFCGFQHGVSKILGHHPLLPPSHPSHRRCLKRESSIGDKSGAMGAGNSAPKPLATSFGEDAAGRRGPSLGSLLLEGPEANRYRVVLVTPLRIQVFDGHDGKSVELEDGHRRAPSRSSFPLKIPARLSSAFVAPGPVRLGMAICFEGLRLLKCRASRTPDPGEPASDEATLSNSTCSLSGCNAKMECTSCSELRAQVKELEDQLKEAMKLLAQPSRPNDTASRDGECVVCMAQPRRYAFTPCGHRCVCHLCAVGVCQSDRRCPICRAKVVRMLRIIDA
eukprot:s1089_g17.t5